MKDKEDEYTVVFQGNFSLFLILLFQSNLVTLIASSRQFPVHKN